MNKKQGKSVPKQEIQEHYHFSDCHFDWINYNTDGIKLKEITAAWYTLFP